MATRNWVKGDFVWIAPDPSATLPTMATDGVVYRQILEVRKADGAVRIEGDRWCSSRRIVDPKEWPMAQQAG